MIYDFVTAVGSITSTLSLFEVAERKRAMDNFRTVAVFNIMPGLSAAYRLVGSVYFGGIPGSGFCCPEAALAAATEIQIAAAEQTAAARRRLKRIN